MDGKSAVIQTEKDGPSEADGVHDGLDLGHSIFYRANVRDRVRQPDPGLVEQYDATERGELVEEGLEFGHGPEQLDVADERPGEDELDRPVAEHLIRQAEIAAGCVRRFRHGIDHTDPGRYESRLWRSCVPLGRRAVSRRAYTTADPSTLRFRFVTAPDGGDALALEREVNVARSPLAGPSWTLYIRAGRLPPNRPNRPHGCRTY